MTKTNRRDWLKTWATVPVAGMLAYSVYKKIQHDRTRRSFGDIYDLNSSDTKLPAIKEGTTPLRIGIIGFGIRGKLLLRALGFALPEEVDKLKKAAQDNPEDNRYKMFMEQENLNIQITAVCDIFDTYAKQGMEAAANIYREGVGGKMGALPKRYNHYREMLADKDIDAVIIATPDHWHGQMTIEAALAGKHIYLEKPLSWTVPETYAIRDVVTRTGVVFQLGHQGRQTDSYIKAKKIIEKGLIGPISLIEVCTNRNDPNGAWVYNIPDSANESTIDWQQFIPFNDRRREYESYMTSNRLNKYMGPEAYEQFSLERFFRWRCWWDYSTGLSGDLLTHEYDCVNQILNVGIPHSATSSGGVYFFKDGRTVPDVLQTTFEFPNKNLTLLYSATLANSRQRSKVFMGHDASMELDKALTIYADRRSTRYKEKLDSGEMSTETPIYTYIPGAGNIDAMSSATERYFAQRGLLYSYVDGKPYNTTFLHLREWLECIRQGLAPSCGIKEAFEEAIAAHMGTRAYLEGRTMYWDEKTEQIVR